MFSKVQYWLKPLTLIFTSVYVSGGDTTQGIIPDLRANTTYHVTVAVYNSKDQELPQTAPVAATTSKKI